MEISGAVLALVIIAIVALAVLAAVAIRRGQQGDGPTPSPAALTPPSVAPARPQRAGLGQTLHDLQLAGRWDELLRLLDRSLPEWPVSSSLIEVARATSALDRDLAAVQGTPVAGVVIDRLADQSRAVSDNLWSLADRLVVAQQLSRAPSPEQLQQEDAVLLRLLPAIREAQSGLAELTLVDSGADGLRRAEGRFLALAASARDLHDLGPAPALLPRDRP